MFIKITDNPLPKLYPEVVRKLDTIEEKGWVEVDGFRLRKNIDYIPMIGLQEECISSDADVVFMAGASSMGKTFSVMMDSLRGVGKHGYTGAIISKRLNDSAKGGSIFRDFKLMYDGFADFSVTISNGIPIAYSETFENSIRLIHSNFNIDNNSEWNQFQEFAKKTQASFMATDEMTDMPFRMWTYWMSRNRDSTGKARFLGTFNPKYEHWTRDFIDYYIDPDTHYVIKDRIGKIRYFFIGDAKSAKEVIWGDTKEEVLEKVNINVTDQMKKVKFTNDKAVKSFTFLTAEAADNYILVADTGGSSLANLFNSGDKARLLEGYFGPVDDESSNISDRVIRRLFSNPQDNSNTLYCTMDVSGGGEKGDLCLIGVWKGLTLIHVEQTFIKNDPTEVKHWVRDVLHKWGVSVSNFAFDANGIGYFLREFKNGIAVMPQSRQMPEIDIHGNVSPAGAYRTLRSQLLAKTEALIITGDISCDIDKNKRFIHGRNKTLRTLEEILIDEKDVFRNSIVDKRIYYKSKQEFQKKYNFSPDFIDIIMLRSIFELDARPRKEEEPEYLEEDYYF